MLDDGADFVTSVDGHMVVKPSGEIDMETAATFQRAVDHALAVSAEVLTLDLSDVSFMDSAGLRVIAVAAQRAPNRVAVRNPCRQVGRLLEVSGIGRLVTIE